MSEHPLRLAVIPDFGEEQWPSMDLCAEMLLKHLETAAEGRLVAERVCPPFRRRFTRIPLLGRKGVAHNADRFRNRYRLFPRFVRNRAADFDFFHVCDHSYAHLVHNLPAGRVGVYCHDLDTFRCLLDPRSEPRPRWFRSMMRNVLTGFEKAAIVFCTTQAIRSEIIRHALMEPSRIVVAPNGIAPEFSPSAPSRAVEAPYLLHVGSCIARKRIDVLLDVFATMRAAMPELSLVQIGGEWSAPQREQIERFGIGSHIKQIRGITRLELANWYRGASLVLQPSSAEGFGLPIVEALACGAPVVASDLPVLHEVGGPAVIFAPVADVPAWSTIVQNLLKNPSSIPPLESRLSWAGQFSWRRQAQTIADTYLKLLAG